MKKFLLSKAIVLVVVLISISCTKNGECDPSAGQLSYLCGCLEEDGCALPGGMTETQSDSLEIVSKLPIRH